MQRLVCFYCTRSRRSYYDVLGLPNTATAAELKKAFYTLSKKYHPDITGANEAATKKFVAVKEAYDTLRDNDKRQAYDSQMSGSGYSYGNPNLEAWRNRAEEFTKKYPFDNMQFSQSQQPPIKASSFGHFFDPTKEMKREKQNETFFWTFAAAVLLIIVGNILHVSFFMNTKNKIRVNM